MRATVLAALLAALLAAPWGPARGDAPDGDADSDPAAFLVMAIDITKRTNLGKVSDRTPTCTYIY